ncbi:Cyclic di-GMP phosphodiesterase response regulator RpfG [Comamonas aquatica]|uniref:HD-GYP domain-containing protein n=1 Tax=Comamonas aquatica TaxID=225991 RepID=UPI001EF2574C|nr:HD-GYP domain-containing protein [Comamonas aquatica]CAB5682144.1 Cyclic di-GMP phosphodiesterase response regulator RpfG [Comamonas aquatica]CAC9217052.1 Cyclic di-GMP phosphodiesterase response regulator RpfG [Comamonas aquatica]
MIKEIHKKDLKLGMYIQKFLIDWIDNPFWKSEFHLTSQKDLEIILCSKIEKILIDCDKGLCVKDCCEIDSKIDLSSNVEDKKFSDAIEEDDYLHASEVILKTHHAVHSMFNQARMGKAIDVDQAKNLAQDITRSVLRNGRALISLARLKSADNYTYMHSVAVAGLMASLAKQLCMQKSDIQKACFAGLMHDLGKAAIPLEILNKPGKLTDDEFDVVRRHPLQGYELLVSAGVNDETVLDVCLHHHEKMDGTGYPKSLNQGNMSLMARMAAICDIYDAITSNRPYKNGWDPAESIKLMSKWCGDHLDTRVFHAFVKAIGIYPIGSLVRVNSNMLGVVVDQNEKTLLKPMVKVFFSIDEKKHIEPMLLDLFASSKKYEITQREDPADWSIGDWNKIWAEYSPS